MNRATPDTAPDSPPPDPTRARLVAERVHCAPARLDCEIDLHLAPGEVLQIEGPNGSGKTSLLRVLCGLVPPDAGHIRWDGTDIAEDPERFRRDLTFIGHTAGIKRDLTARENLEAAHAIAGGPAGIDHADALARVGLANDADVPLRRLSAGQARRVTLARLLTERSALWILDEPFTALDAEAKRMLEGFIVAHCEAGGMALVTTHQPADFGALPVRLLALGGHEVAT
ncbi:MAG: cytochrome c biogenesis heme-transporting ATPase CcmA [Halofilum sp. (in: g-proteobacteria)]|nr:cytochrome c biogenesis heme-transporting ATPase CcmA [Halofilum sp. (in: g-proteobacteria)]